MCVCSVLVIDDDFQLSSFAEPDPANYFHYDGQNIGVELIWLNGTHHHKIEAGVTVFPIKTQGTTLSEKDTSNHTTGGYFWCYTFPNSQVPITPFQY